MDGWMGVIDLAFFCAVLGAVLAISCITYWCLLRWVVCLLLESKIK